MLDRSSPLFIRAVCVVHDRTSLYGSEFSVGYSWLRRLRPTAVYRPDAILGSLRSGFLEKVDVSPPAYPTCAICPLSHDLQLGAGRQNGVLAKNLFGTTAKKKEIARTSFL
ncbi:hypothetical protein J6590_036340 [Homalodisca vitripennis]|nr:hypothetical protein J6590_036340 [Homalodisca vitripennis]